MKPFILGTIFSFLHLISYSQTQSELNQIADKGYRISKNKMNTLYARILKDNKADTLFVKNFKKAQQIWLKYCEAALECKYPTGNENEQGSCMPMCYAIDKTYLVNQRIKWFKDVIISKEGDICR